MADDLVAQLRDCIEVLETKNAELEAENAALKARLEIDPAHNWDGIACRDETIRLLELKLAERSTEKARKDVEDGPYLVHTVAREERKFNPNYGSDRICKCGHRYYRHFDWMEDNIACGCKYCACFTFEEAPPEGRNNRL